MNWFANPNNIEWLANIITIVAFPVAIAGLMFVGRQMKNDRLAVSAGAIAEMRASIMARVDRVQLHGIAGNVSAWTDEVHELFNDLEMACAIYLDGQMSGRTGRLAKNMICDFLEMISNDSDLRDELASAIHAHDTFTNMRDFKTKVKRHAKN